jgi:hypothetical protein
MTPLPVNPTVVILVDGSNGGAPLRAASNIAPLPEFSVIVTDNPHEYKELALGKPFEQGIGEGTPPSTATLPTVSV